MKLAHIRYLDVTDPLASGHAFLSAASGLVQIGNILCVVGDDEKHLAIFNQNDDGPGRLIRLLPGDLPRKAKKRKAAKPDFEILFHLPTSGGGASGLICAMGSGSTKKRMRGALINLDTGDVTVLDLKHVFAAIALVAEEINLEGAAVRGDRLLLFNRGNMANPQTQIFEIALSAITADHDVQGRLVKSLALPVIDGVPLTVTDTCALDDGRFILSAVAEITDDSYADGDILAAAIILLNAGLDVVAIEHLEPTVKVEGVIARCTAEGFDLLCVSDADNPDMPSSLYSAKLQV